MLPYKLMLVFDDMKNEMGGTCGIPAGNKKCI
jgi:hypothetical protein